MQDVEEWRPVVGFERYQVSSLGRVHSSAWRQHLSNGVSRMKPARMLKGSPHPSGHLLVSLWRDGMQHNKYVHSLVAAAFLGPRPAGHEVCHQDGVPSNNKVANLRYDTRGGNVRDKRRHGTDHQVNKTHCPRNHALVTPNIVASHARLNHRACLACARARGEIQRHPERNLEMTADRHYQRIINGASFTLAAV